MLFDWLKRQFRKAPTGAVIPLAAANDNCFWKSLLGSPPVFEVAAEMRTIRERVALDSSLDTPRRLRIIDSCTTYLELFEALYVANDLSKAKQLAPKLNIHVPELMSHCPEIELRPSANR